MYQLDVKSAFLYGLKQAPRAWYSRIEHYFSQAGFVKCPHEHTLFTQTNAAGEILIVSLYVDDLIFTGSSVNLFEEFKSSMKNEFDMSDLGKMKYFLGVEVWQGDRGIFICQQKYAREVLERFGMEDSKVVGVPIVPGSKITRAGEGRQVDTTEFKRMVGSFDVLNCNKTRPSICC